MSIESPKVKPKACDNCRRLNIQCDLDNYIDDCERCTRLGEKCFITDDYNITIYKVPQRTLHKFRSAEFIFEVLALHYDLHSNQSNGEKTSATIDKIVSKFKGISEEAINYQEFKGFFAYHFTCIISWFKTNREHQVWTFARYDQKTRQSLIKLGAILKSLDCPDYSASAACFLWQIDTIKAEEQSLRESLSGNYNQTHTASSDPANEPERMLSADIQAGESQAEESQDGELQDGKAPKNHSI
ncbi:hypothetical protein BHYA_0074g00250 [Botrytis hyacinthi]|uniref:Zn(2)-C6 fungal-type domain-containing protein n=1 Tax=Botrytis hyacinthi TaxID=278943 RepID=A0A4Z1GYS0_9HELO|nr:hypothetical protein BHYA_0074g00250 [Botrytis hyacinthi]